MGNGLYEEREKLFIKQSGIFINKLLSLYEYTNLAEVPKVTERPSVPIEPVVIDDFLNLTTEQCNLLKRQFYSDLAVAHFIILNPTVKPISTHPLLDITKQLANYLHLHYPIHHPLEEHAESLKRFGWSDGTVKVYDLAGVGGALTSRDFGAHQDGLGGCGDVETIALYADSAPLCGGYTYFQNICRLGLELARDDREAFDSLFLPDAIKIVRETGKLRIKVTTPVFYLGKDGQPQSSFRISDSEYKVFWRGDSEALSRAKTFLLRYTRAFDYGTSFVHFTSPGQGCFNQNQLTIHGRTAYQDKYLGNQMRVLSRKWFATSLEYSKFKLVPGIRILPEYASLYPDLFRPELLEGSWLYDLASDENVRQI